MSEQQKIFASLSGAVVAHLLLLILVFGLLSTKSAGSSLKDGRRPQESGPKEVTILMSELMEQIEVEPILPKSRPFVSTDMNQAEAVAPENARFESDRNTSAASELPPDPTLPGEELPTLDGDNPLPSLTLQNRDYVEGQLNEPAASPAGFAQGRPSPPSSPAQGNPFPGNPAPQSDADAPPEARKDPGEDNQAIEGGKDRPEETVAEKRERPEGEDSAEVASKEIGRADDDDEETRSQRSFTDPFENPEARPLGPMSSDADRFAAAGGEPGDGKNSSDAEEVKKQAQAENAESTPRDGPAPSEASSESGLKLADEGLFANGFSPEERQNAINGSLARVGRNAVDAEETALGRYKKAVRDVISARWHRYRQDNADFVTWGILKLEFTVDAGGRVNDLHITKNEANAILAEFTLKAIRDAKLPPMPEDVAKSVGPQGLVIQYDIIIY